MAFRARTPEEELDRQIKFTKTLKKREEAKHVKRLEEFDKRIEDLEDKKRNVVQTNQ